LLMNKIETVGKCSRVDRSHWLVGFILFHSRSNPFV
jgi:hypothetical protein